jgi:hypothetical protein
MGPEADDPLIYGVKKRDITVQPMSNLQYSESAVTIKINNDSVVKLIDNLQ